MAEGYSVLGLSHVHITTPAELLEDVVKWYESCLGLRQIEKPEGARPEGAWLRIGPQELHVSVDEHNPPKAQHFALAVDELDAVISCLRDEGCHIEQARTIPGRRRFFTRDPAGNRIEVVKFEETKTMAVEEGTPDQRARILHEES